MVALLCCVVLGCVALLFCFVLWFVCELLVKSMGLSMDGPRMF